MRRGGLPHYLDCENAGLVLKNVTESCVSDCLISNKLPDATSWEPLKTIGGGKNRIDKSLLVQSAEKPDGSGHLPPLD